MGKRASGKSDQSSGFPSSVLGTVQEKNLPMDQIQGRREEERVEEGERQRTRERVREKENSQPADRREDVEQRKTFHPTPGGSETPQGDSERVERALLTPRGDKLVERAMRSTSAGEGEKREELGQTVAPSPETSTPPERRDFVGAEGAMEKKHSESQREGSSPTDNLETHAQGNDALSTEMEEEVVTSREAEKIEEGEMKEDETTERGEGETCTSFEVKPTAQTGQNETEPTLSDEEVVDQKGVEEGVLKMLAETDWEIEPVEEREGEETPRPAVTVPVEAGADGKVAEMSAKNRPGEKAKVNDHTACGKEIKRMTTAPEHHTLSHVISIIVVIRE